MICAKKCSRFTFSCKTLRGLIEGREEKVRDYIFIEYTGGAVPSAFAVRSLRYKYVETEGESFAYDLLKDTLEQHSINQQEFTPQLNALQKHLRERMKAVNKLN